MSQKLSFARFLLIALIICVPAAAEDHAAKEKAGLPALPLTNTLPRNYPVITVQSRCAKAANSARVNGCRTVITRAEFEELVHAINPRMIKLERRQLAQTYGRMLALSNEALSRGLDKKPEVQALLRYVQASALGSAMYKQVLRASNEHSEEDLQKYFHAHEGSFDRYTFQRLFIPVTKQGQASPLDTETKEEQPSFAAEMKALADKVHARALAGEDFVALQKEVFAQAGIKSEPNVEVPDMQMGTLPKEHSQAFELAPGAVSAVFTDPSGYSIYKMISKRSVPFASVKEQVAIEMENHRSEEALKKVESVKVNDSYFDKYDTPPPDPNEPEGDDD